MFFWSAIFLQTSLLGAALAVDSIEDVLSIVGAIFATTISFLFPGLAFLVACRNHGTGSMRKQWDTCFYLLMSIIFILCFITVVAAFIYFQVTKSPSEKSAI